MARSSLLLLGLLLFSITLPNWVEAKHFVLVHGGGHGAWCWYKITTLLQQAGHQVTAIDLTSNGISKDFADNVTTVAQYVQPLTQFLANNVQSHEKVILVAHSFSGGGISYAMELFSKKISVAVFLAAIMPAYNETYLPLDIAQDESFIFEERVVYFNFANGSALPPTSVSFNLSLVMEYLYNQSPLEDVNLAKSLLNATPTQINNETLTLTPSKYGSIRRYYIRTGFDRFFLPAVQAKTIQKNPPYKVLMIPRSDHSTFFSKPLILNGLLLNIASEA